MSLTKVPKDAIVVGVDGSRHSTLALDWAAAEASRRHLPLHIVDAYSYGFPITSVGMGMPEAMADVREVVDGECQDAVKRVLANHPGLTVSSHAPASSPAAALIDASQTADTLVVGARGRGAGRAALLGSVSVQVAAHAHCPVVVVREPQAAPSSSGPVVVGVDGSSVSSQAIGYAYEQASSRGVGLVVVHAWWLEFVEGASASATWSVDWDRMAEEENVLVAQSLAGWAERYPDVPVRRHGVRTHPVEALVRESEEACLLVVGSRGRGGFAGLMLGSVSQEVMRQAHCPVAVVRNRRTSPTEPADSKDGEHHLPVPPVRERV